MVLMILERVTPSLRGELTRWLIQPRTGVFVGTVSALVRDKLWDKAVAALEALKPPKSGRRPGAMMVYTTNSEQGFAVRTTGQTDRTIQDFEGLLLAKTPQKAR
jgi:CRISPR-associated protein Cas2